MELSELTSYALEKYNIPEQHKWADFPAFSVLVHPDTGKWVALLMRQWDTDTGELIEICDLKCGRQSLQEFPRSYLGDPVRMHGNKWISIFFRSETEKDIVFKLFDRAYTSGEQRGYTITIGGEPVVLKDEYKETALPFSGSSYRAERVIIPEKIKAMRKLFVYGRESLPEKAMNFVRQGMFMQDYEDEYPWNGYFNCYYPTYHDLTIEQLRGYFSWRSDLRKGKYTPVPSSVAYIYIYELLNGIGVSTPEETLTKLEEFRDNYLPVAQPDQNMQKYLRRWMFEFALLKGLPKETLLRYADPKQMQNDASILALKDPENVKDEELFTMLSYLSGKYLQESLLFKKEPAAAAAKRLFCAVYCKIVKGYCVEGNDFFKLLYGNRTIRRYYPLANAVYLKTGDEKDRVVELNDNRVYSCENGLWTVASYEKLSFNAGLFRAFLHGTDCLLRKYLKTGHYLRLKEDEEWLKPFVEEAIRDDRIAAKKAAVQEIKIDLSGLDKIRADAWQTQNSLLIEEESEDRESETEEISANIEVIETVPEEEEIDLPLNAVEIRILRELLAGHPVNEILKNEHLMPSIVADAINGALIDEIGDTVLDCEDDCLSLVEDYIEEVKELLGGKG
ncbi:MAG: TerB N-terminal domain-containing protein [Erysipelotrichaceae bacterium]|nr:TerB N-terminal domain-containing protein [Erysipelotrichaceae bacterium]